jgi:death-on-curing protein
VTAFLSFEDIVRQVQRAGFVVRDAGLLASAIARPQASAFGVDAYPDLFDKAAALSVDRQQPSVGRREQTAGLDRHQGLPPDERLAAVRICGRR